MPHTSAVFSHLLTLRNFPTLFSMPAASSLQEDNLTSVGFVTHYFLTLWIQNPTGWGSLLTQFLRGTPLNLTPGLQKQKHLGQKVITIWSNIFVEDWTVAKERTPRQAGAVVITLPLPTVDTPAQKVTLQNMSPGERRVVRNGTLGRHIKLK